MLYPFSAVEPEEVSAAAGERIKVAVDLGDWLHVITQSGACRGGCCQAFDGLADMVRLPCSALHLMDRLTWSGCPALRCI